MSYGYSHVDVDLTTPNDLDGFAQNAGLFLSHPLNDNRTLVGDVGFNYRHITSELDNVVTNRDEIRSLQTGLTFNKFDRHGRTLARLQQSLGLDWLGANNSFWKSELYLTRLFRLPHDNILMLRAYGQYSPGDLPSAEAFQIGGAFSVRGYHEGLLIGDRGYNLTIEDRFPIPFLRHFSPWLADRLQGAVFFDVGQTWFDRSNDSFISNASQRTLLAGTGFGIRARLSQYLQGFVDIGFGLMNRSAVIPAGYADPTARVHFGIRSNLLPQDLKKREAGPSTMSRMPVMPASTVAPDVPQTVAPDVAPPPSDATDVTP
jgi:hemolysin activation/secretion protein